MTKIKQKSNSVTKNIWKKIKLNYKANFNEFKHKLFNDAEDFINYFPDNELNEKKFEVVFNELPEHIKQKILQLRVRRLEIDNKLLPEIEKLKFNLVFFKKSDDENNQKVGEKSNQILLKIDNEDFQKNFDLKLPKDNKYLVYLDITPLNKFLVKKPFFNYIWENYKPQLVADLKATGIGLAINLPLFLLFQAGVLGSSALIIGALANVLLFLPIVLAGIAVAAPGAVLYKAYNPGTSFGNMAKSIFNIKNFAGIGFLIEQALAVLLIVPFAKLIVNAVTEGIVKLREKFKPANKLLYFSTAYNGEITNRHRLKITNAPVVYSKNDNKFKYIGEISEPGFKI